MKTAAEWYDTFFTQGSKVGIDELAEVQLDARAGMVPEGEVAELKGRHAGLWSTVEGLKTDIESLKAERHRLEKVNAELRAKLRAKGSEVPCHRCGLSKMEADKLGVADMTGPQLRLRVLQLEGELADYKAHAWVEMGDYIVVQRQRDQLRELALEALEMLSNADATHRAIRGYGVVDSVKGGALYDRARELGAWPALGVEVGR